MKKISIDKLFRSFMIVIVVLVFATILTHINDNRNLQKDEAFIREAFENECSNYDGKGGECINISNCEYDETAKHCRPRGNTTDCRKYQVTNYDNEQYTKEYKLLSSDVNELVSTDDCNPDVPNALDVDIRQNLRTTEIQAIGNRISDSKDATKNAVDDYIEREQQQNAQVDTQKQEEITAAQIVISHKHNLDTLRHKIYKEIGAV